MINSIAAVNNPSLWIMLTTLFLAPVILYLTPLVALRLAIWACEFASRHPRFLRLANQAITISAGLLIIAAVFTLLYLLGSMLFNVMSPVWIFFGYSHI